MKNINGNLVGGCLHGDVSFHHDIIQWPSSGSTSVEKLIVREPGGSISTNFGSKAHSDFLEGIYP